MRFLSILALSVFALTATAQSYTVTGKIDAKYNGKQMCLTEQSVVVDTVVIADGALLQELGNDLLLGRTVKQQLAAIQAIVGIGEQIVQRHHIIIL